MELFPCKAAKNGPAYWFFATARPVNVPVVMRIEFFFKTNAGCTALKEVIIRYIQSE